MLLKWLDYFTNDSSFNYLVRLAAKLRVLKSVFVYKKFTAYVEMDVILIAIVTH